MSIEVPISLIGSDCFQMVSPSRWEKRHPETSDFHPVPDLDLDVLLIKFRHFLFETTTNLGVSRILQELNDLGRHDVVTVEEKNSPVRCAQSDHDSWFVGVVFLDAETSSLSVDAEDPGAFNCVDEAADGIREDIRHLVDDFEESCLTFPKESTALELSGDFGHRSWRHVLGWIVAKDVRQHVLSFEQEPLITDRWNP